MDKLGYKPSYAFGLLAAETGELLVESWDFINHLPVYTYAETLFLYLLAEKAAYGGSGIKGRQSRRWTLTYEVFSGGFF